MVAVGMLLIWGGYSVSLWGWCLLRGYNVTLGQLVSPLHPYGQGKGQGWPPARMPDTQVFPGPGSSPGGTTVTEGGGGGSNVDPVVAAQEAAAARLRQLQGRPITGPGSRL